MAADRYVVVGVAQVRSAWFREVARWATPRCCRWSSSRRCRSRRCGCACAPATATRPWWWTTRSSASTATSSSWRARRATRWSSSTAAARRARGASSACPPCCRRVRARRPRPGAHPGGQPDRPHRRQARRPRRDRRPGFRGHLVAVTGAGGTGRSTVAAAISRDWPAILGTSTSCASPTSPSTPSRRCSTASADVVPGLVELVEAHRVRPPSIDEVRRLTWHVAERDYHLLLGLRRHRDWTAVRPCAFATALDGLRRGFRVVVADVDADLEGEQATGSLDVEERNAIARTTLLAADLVVVVGLPGMKGLHSLLRTTRDLLAHGVPGRTARCRSSTALRRALGPGRAAAAFGELLDGSGARPRRAEPDPPRRAPPARRGAARPRPPARRLARPARRHRPGPPRRRPTPRRRAPLADDALLPVRPGTLGTWTDDVTDGPVRGRRGRASRRRGRARTSRRGSPGSRPGRGRCPRPASRRGWPRRAAPSRCCARTTRG